MSTDWTVDLAKPITSLDKASEAGGADVPHDQGPRDGLSHVVGAPVAAAAGRDHRRAARRNGRRPPRRDRRGVLRQRPALDLARTERGGAPLRRRPGGARLRQGRPHRHLGAEPAGMAADPVRDRGDRRGDGQHQPGLPAGGAGIRAQQGRLQRGDPGGILQDQPLPGDAAIAGAGAGGRRARQAAIGKAAPSAHRHPHGRRHSPPAWSISATLPAWPGRRR